MQPTITVDEFLPIGRRAASPRVAVDGPRLAAPSCRLGFALFILVNATLFLRPAEIFPALENWPIYLIIIWGSLLASLPLVIAKLNRKALRESPATLFVVALIAPIFLSNLAHGNLYDARMGAKDFLKVIIYFLLWVSLVNSRNRFKLLLTVIVGFLFIVSTLAILEYHQVVDIPAFAPLDQSEYGGGEESGALRLRGTGVFNDPNDMSLILGAAMVIVGHYIVAGSGPLRTRALTFPIFAVFGYGFVLTQSRGGFLALLAAMLAYVFSRFGRRRGIWISLCLLPLLLLMVAGRQTNIDLENGDDTAQGRILLWRDAFAEFRSAPIFGIGYDQLADAIGHVAHNSYVHAFTELGVVGGILFTGCLYLPLATLAAQLSRRRLALSASLQWWCPCIFAVLVGYAVGMFSLSRTYAVTSYVIIGMAVALCGLMEREQPAAVKHLSWHMVRRVTIVSIGFLIFINIVVRVFAR